MKKRKKTPRERRVQSRIKFVLGEGQTLFVSCGGMIRPGLSRVFVTNKKGKITVWADATSGSHFTFRRGRGTQSEPHFQLCNLDYRETLENYLDQKFWGQFNWGQLFAYGQNRNFRQKIRRRIKQLVAEFEARTAKELNAVPRPTKTQR